MLIVNHSLGGTYWHFALHGETDDLGVLHQFSDIIIIMLAASEHFNSIIIIIGNNWSAVHYYKSTFSPS